MKKRRNAFDKLNTLLFGKDLRIMEGEPYTEIREFDFSSYYPEDKYISPQELPIENVYNICDYGAGIDKDDNAQYINHAISKASETNGVVLVCGGEFVSTTIELKSNVTLFIDKGSSICANKTGKGYRDALLVADNADNITLTGGGKLKGNGHLFGRKPQADKNNTSPAKYIDVIEMRRDYRSQLRFAHPSKYGGVVAFTDCSNVNVNNFIIENSAHWTFKLSNCQDVNIRNFIINNNRNVANADGIDIAGAS
ncbi:MAG: hypothetical protein K2H01_00420, partial [Ruminococcus sp.]|nr:hypothetical protein [Ruminococcus sp.]